LNTWERHKLLAIGPLQLIPVRFDADTGFVRVLSWKTNSGVGRACRQREVSALRHTRGRTFQNLAKDRYPRNQSRLPSFSQLHTAEMPRFGHRYGAESTRAIRRL
jgi:hypothetical protein